MESSGSGHAVTVAIQPLRARSTPQTDPPSGSRYLVPCADPGSRSRSSGCLYDSAAERLEDLSRTAVSEFVSDGSTDWNLLTLSERRSLIRAVIAKAP